MDSLENEIRVMNDERKWCMILKDVYKLKKKLT